MSNKILTREESDFFSPPLTAGPLRNELFPVRYSGFARDIFSQSPEPCVCAVLAASDGEMRRLLENIANAAQNEGVLLVCDPSPEQGLPAGITTPLARPVFGADGVSDSGALTDMLRLTEDGKRIAHIFRPQSGQLRHLEALLQAQMQASRFDTAFFTLLPPSVDPALLAFALASYPVILTAEGWFTASGRSRPSGSPEDRILADFEEHRRLELKDGLLEAIIDTIPEPVVVGYTDGSLAGANKAFFEAGGYAPHDLPTLNWLQDMVREDFRATQEAMFEAMLTTGLDQEFQTELRTAEDRVLPCSVRLFPHAVDGRIAFFHAICALNAEAPAPSGTDKREMFLLRLRLALQRLDRQRGYRFAILGLGVDYASASHPDEATQFADLIARRTASCLRALDVPAHFDPKRLFIFLDDIRSTVDAVRVAQRIQNEMARPLTIGQTEHEVRCDVGVVLPPIPHPGEDEMLRAAQIALGRAERRGQITFYDERQNDEALRFLRMEKELRAALDNDELELRFVPVRDMNSSRIAGAEAVLHWRRPHREPLSAGEFLPLVERSSIIRDLDAWCLRESCAMLERMKNAENIFLVLGISLKSILRSGFADEAIRQVRERGLASTIFLKAREAWLESHGDLLAAFFAKAHEAGLCILLDRFTADRVNLGRLHELALDGLILDETLLAHPPVTASVGAMAAETGLWILLPGPVDPAAGRSLHKHSCHLLGWRDTETPPLTVEELLGLPASEPAH